MMGISAGKNKLLVKKNITKQLFNLCIHKFQHNQEQIRTMVFPVGFPNNPPLLDSTGVIPGSRLLDGAGGYTF